MSADPYLSTAEIFLRPAAQDDPPLIASNVVFYPGWLSYFLDGRRWFIPSDLVTSVGSV